MKILIVEDDKKIASFLKKGLEEEHYSIDLSHNGDEAIYLCGVNSYDLIILDIMLPGSSGVEVCKRVREKEIFTPIIMLTAKNTISDKVEGLNEGANDYLTKPFSFEELLARIKVQLRRNATPNNILTIDNLQLNCNTFEVKRDNKKIDLTSKEYALLEYFLRNRDKIITEEMINSNIWNIEEITASNIVSVYVYRLRNKIDKNYNKKLIHTIRGVGYKMSEK